MPDTAVVTPISAPKAIAVGGLLSGAADLIFAIVYYGRNGATPMGILQSVAGGLLGKKAAHEGGIPTALLGFGLHFLISCSAAAAYLLLSRKISLLRESPFPCGMIYGAMVYFFMNMVVLPLSAYHSSAFPPPLALAPIAIHVFGIGLPIAFAVRKYAR